MRCRSCIFGFFLLLVLSGCAAQGANVFEASPYRDPATLQKGQILHLATGRILTEPELIDFLSHFPVVYIGETHDNVDAHDVQFSILKGLYGKLPGKMALGLEMLPRGSQSMVNAYVQGRLNEKEFARLWVKNWGHTFPYYREILAYARENRIPLLALNTDDDVKNAVRKHALHELDPDTADRLPDMDLDDPYYEARTRSIFEGHHMGPKNSDKFLRVQTLWDETMAETAAEFLTSPEGKGMHLIVLAGGHHVTYGFGIPRRLFRRVSLPYAVVSTLMVEIPENKKDRLMDVTLPDLPLSPADFYWAVGYRDLEDLKKERPSEN